MWVTSRLVIVAIVTSQNQMYLLFNLIVLHLNLYQMLVNSFVLSATRWRIIGKKCLKSIKLCLFFLLALLLLVLLKEKEWECGYKQQVRCSVRCSGAAAPAHWKEPAELSAYWVRSPDPACPTGRRPWSTRRCYWREYIYRLAWERFNISLDKLEEVAGEREVLASLLKLLPPRPKFTKENGSFINYLFIFFKCWNGFHEFSNAMPNS